MASRAAEPPRAGQVIGPTTDELTPNLLAAASQPCLAKPEARRHKRHPAMRSEQGLNAHTHPRPDPQPHLRPIRRVKGGEAIAKRRRRSFYVKWWWSVWSAW
ncbi:hypothetical protein GCM10023214_56860 [Amycolatopsis dongchuanensis]|uniref:Uncharacterized protein n=1 Tax=Amycolatopsis dongchuanensis TaxID=1070866 RepID=A0ABP8VBA4_9PSEU